MDYKFCYLCGGQLNKKRAHHYICTKCGQQVYRNSKPCVEIALFNSRGEVLLAKRGAEPYKGKYDLPGGFVDFGEVLEEAILREIHEELGLNEDQITKLEYLTSYSTDYPWGNEVHKVLVSEFVAQVKDDTLNVVANDDVAEAKWIAVENIDQSQLSVPEIWPTLQLAVKKSKGVEDVR